MFSPLLDTIIEREKWPVLTMDTLDDFLKDSGEVVLFIAGNAARFPETNDVAVILPEILKELRGRLTATVIAPESEREVQKRYHFNKFPALIFLRDGGYLGAIPKVLDWVDYMREVPEILAREVTEIPGFVLPDGCRSHVQQVQAEQKDVLGIHAEPGDSLG